MVKVTQGYVAANSLMALNPKLAEEWHPTKNGSLTPYDVTAGSNSRAWWLCKKGHEWEATIKNRAKGIGCQYCSNRKASKDNCLHVLNPSLSGQWHPTKNGNLTPYDVTPYSSGKAWWICVNGHEWEAVIRHRALGVGCPYCSGLKATKENCLAVLNPLLAEQWHPTRNGSLTPRNVTGASGKVVWWICVNRHEWKARIASRAGGDGCPYCYGRFASKDNCLQTANPALAKEWHPTKNGSLTPYDVMAGSDKKVWWKCERGHEWEALIYNRAKGIGCPCCAGQKVCPDNCLQNINPELSSEWLSSRNGKLTPADVTAGSHKKVWWKCQKGHEWQATVQSRTIGRGCPHCAGRIANSDNCLAARNPSTAKEWHPVRNGTLTPNDVTAGSSKRVWWMCQRGHEWEAVIYNRSYGTGCPYCADKLACNDNCLQTVNPDLAKEWHPTRNGTLTPNDVTTGAGKKVWWLCKNGHEWQAVINDRSAGNGCPYCSGRKKQTSQPELL